jgi:hypothetical protein
MTDRVAGAKIPARTFSSEEIPVSKASSLPDSGAEQADKYLNNKENSTWPKANHYKTHS